MDLEASLFLNGHNIRYLRRVGSFCWKISIMLFLGILLGVKLSGTCLILIVSGSTSNHLLIYSMFFRNHGPLLDMVWKSCYHPVA